MRKKIITWLIIVLVIAFLALTAGTYFLRRHAMAGLEPVEPPQGAQLLVFPIDDGVITAGFQNANYLEKNGFPHYGLDITSANGGHAEILAAGNGVVLGTELCNNSLGNITVIRHNNVYLPETGETIDLIGRYYHMTSLLIAEGEFVTAGQVIGTIDGGHKWHHHIHLELDADLEYPFHTPQVAEASSVLLNRYPADGQKMLDPISVLAANAGQHIYVHPLSDSCTEKDDPRYAVK